ncbi:MAG TPA: hypothetical protein VE981_11670 [Planctomycetota bacterium]|nr:hypothetical protein [Planctomycetota bacterium]
MKVLIAVLLLLPAAAPQDDVVKKIVPDAEKIKKLPKKISKESRDKIEKALGEKLADADLVPVLWECMSTVPAVSSMQKTKVLVTVVTVKGPKGPIRLGVAAATVETTVHVVKILENGDDRSLDAKIFLGQFEGFEYSPNVWNTPDQLTGAIKKAAGSDDAAKELDTLLKVNGAMRAIQPMWDRLMAGIEKKDKAVADEVAGLDKAFEESIKAATGSKFLSPARQDKYKASATSTRTELADLKSLLAAGKFDDAFKKSGQIDSQCCGKCHGPLRGFFRDARVTHAIGNGYFSTKLEVAMADAKLDAAYQAVATGIRKAILLATEAK